MLEILKSTLLFSIVYADTGLAEYSAWHDTGIGVRHPLVMATVPLCGTNWRREEKKKKKEGN